MDLASLRCGVDDELIFSRSRSLSVSLWPNGNLGLCRCFVRFFSETLRWIGAEEIGVLGSYALRCECS